MARMDWARGDGAAVPVLVAGWYCDAARRRAETLGEWVGEDDAEREVAGGGAAAAKAELTETALPRLLRRGLTSSAS
jgi:hypothetical protein